MVHEVGDKHEKGRDGKFEEDVVQTLVLKSQDGDLNAKSLAELGVVNVLVGQPEQKVKGQTQGANVAKHEPRCTKSH